MNFLADAGDSFGTGFQIRNPHHILIGHPERQVFRRFPGQGIILRTGILFQIKDRPEPLEVKPAVFLILEIDGPQHPPGNQFLQGFRELLPHLLQQGGGPAMGGLGFSKGLGGRFGGGIRGRFTVHGAEPGFQTFEVGFHRDSGLADGLFQHFLAEGQFFAGGHRPEEDGVDDASGRFRQFPVIAEQAGSGHLFRGVDDRIGLVTSVGGNGFFRDRVEPVGGGDQGRAVRGDEAVLHRPAGFQQFGGDHQVDLTGPRGQGQDRLTVPEFVDRDREDLEVVGGGAGSLGDSGDGGALHRETCGHRGFDQPVREHPAAFPAQRGNQDADRCCGFRVHAGAGLKREITPLRRRCLKRSQRPGFWTTSVR